MGSKKGTGQIQRGTRPAPTYYFVGTARFMDTPQHDDTGDRYRALLERLGLSNAEFIRRITSQYEDSPETLAFLN